MKKTLFPVFVMACLLFPCIGQSQTITWSEHVAPIVFNHCTTCHRPGEIGPFSLTNYDEAASWSNMMQYITEIRYMPPWKADSKFGVDYLGENYLSDNEIATIKSWVEGGSLEGDPTLAPPTPVFPSGSQVGTPDLVLSFAQTHLHKGTNYDEYRYFVLPTGLTQTKDLVALEMRPGNTKVVHHALVWADTSGSAAALDAQTPEYGYVPGQGVGGGQTDLGDQLPGYVPGARPNVFTNGMAQRLPKGSDLVVQIHYAPTAVDEPDSSTFNLFFADQPATRERRDLRRRKLFFAFGDQFESAALRPHPFAHDHAEAPAGDGQTHINSVLRARHPVARPFRNRLRQITSSSSLATRRMEHELI
jgi:hypothetical protein